MALAKGFRLGPYQIQAAVGAGGMGEVYRAVDTRLDRVVAIKILPEAFATDPQLRERFDREARAISQLTHPHICTLHDVGHQDGVDFLVMEYLEGETLAMRLEKGPLGLDEAIRVAIQIAGALSKAHAAGFVHRDLKPGNVFLTKSGAKLLDFGLAKTRAPAVGEMTALPTTRVNLTVAGTILGTFQYMAPEQLEAREVDERTDIFAFGSVVYEMVTGRKAFEGESQANVMAAILERQPPAMSSIQPATSQHLEHIVGRCLVKDPDHRWQTARDVEEELRWVIDRGDVSSDVPSGRSAVLLERLAWGLLVALVGIAIWTVRGGDVRVPMSEPRLIRFDIATPPTSDPLSFALSPDGRQLAYVASGDDVSRLWVRPLDQTSAHALAGTAGALFPFWSPDSQSIGFFADGKLKRIQAAGGPPRTVADAIIGRGGTWSRDNVILFSPNSGEIFRVSANGGEPVPVTRVERPRQANHRFPSFLPDGRHFLFYAQGDAASRGVYLGSLDKPETQRLLDVNEAAVISAGGDVLFVRENSLFVQALDPQRAVLVGDPVRVAEDVTLTDGLNTAAMSAAAVGTLAYRTGAIKGRLAWFDRAGREIAVVGADFGVASNPELSDDGDRIALDRVVNGNRDIWLVDAMGGTPSRFSFNQVPEYDAVWSPDQTRIVFASNRTGVTDLYQKSSSGAGEEVPLFASPQHKRPLDFSPDGRFLLYREFHSETSWDLLALPLAGDRKPSPVAQSRFEEREGQFSPDGKWVAYQANDTTGSFEIYVQAFPGPGGKWQVSTTGGAQPRWRQDGKELFYIGLDGRMMAVSIQMGVGGKALDFEAPVALFSTRIAEGPVPASNNKHQFAVAVDGRRFLINVVPEGAPPPPISIVLDWDAHLRK